MWGRAIVLGFIVDEARGIEVQSLTKMTVTDFLSLSEYLVSLSLACIQQLSIVQ
jgi:hypothetical protein